MIAHATVGARIIISEEPANSTITTRKISTHPMRCPSFAPVMTSAATASPYTTIVEAAIVGGTPKSSTMPPREIGSAATLNDMSTCARNRLTIGSQDVLRAASCATASGADRSRETSFC